MVRSVSWIHNSRRHAPWSVGWDLGIMRRIRSLPRAFLCATEMIPALSWQVSPIYYLGKPYNNGNKPWNKAMGSCAYQRVWERGGSKCNTLQHTATHCNTLQHTATPCYTLLHTAANGTCVQSALRVRTCASVPSSYFGVAMISRLLKLISLCCKRAL